MPKDFQVRTTAVLLAFFTLAAVCLAWVNLQSEREYVLPEDGVWWVEHGDHLQADNVVEDGPGAKAGIKVGEV